MYIIFKICFLHTVTVQIVSSKVMNNSECRNWSTESDMDFRLVVMTDNKCQSH